MENWSIRPITLCRVKADKGMMTYMSYYGEKIWRPYIFWIIERDGQKVLVDTAIEADQYRNYHPGFKALPFEPLSTFETALAKYDLRPEEIELVIQTHLHFDHCFNTSKCKNASVIVQEEELRFAMDPHPLFANLYADDLIKDLHFECLNGRSEILPGIEVIPVPGHSPGGQAVCIETKAGLAVISGFCSIKENFFPPEDVQERISPFAGYPVMIPGIHFSVTQAYMSLLKIKNLADIILPLHEPELMNYRIIP